MNRTGKFLPHLVRTREELEAAVEHISRFDHFVIDVECPKVDGEFLGTTQNTVSWVGLGVPDRVVLIPMGHPIGPIRVPQHKAKLLPPEGERRVLKNGTLSTAKKTYTIPATHWPPGPQLRQDMVFAILEPLLLSDRIKIGHNLKFDLESISKYIGEVPPGPYVDTMILTHILDENLIKYDLKTLTMDWLRVSSNLDVRKAFYPNLGKIGVETQPMDQVALYLAKDLWYALQFYRDNIALIDAQPSLADVLRKEEMTVYGVLMEMELTGIRIDTEMLFEYGEQLRRERDEVAAQIWDICGESFDITNLDKKKHFLYGPKSKGGQGLKPLSFTKKTNQPQVTQANLEVYAEQGNPLAALLLEWGEKEKLIGTFITGLSEKLVGDRLHTSFNQHRTVTGRLSSSNPNLHQVPRPKPDQRSLRDCFVADPGCKLIVGDYSQMELRIAAYMSGDPELCRVFDEDLDIHTEAAAAMLGIPSEDVTGEQRGVGKTQNLGTLYGAGPDKVAQVANVSVDKAREFVDAYNDRYSGMTAWKRQIIVEAKKSVRPGSGESPFVEIPPFGRKRRLPDLFSLDKYDRARAERQAVNAIVQGYGAYILKQAMRDLSEKIKGTDIKLLLNVHDELVVMAPEAQAEEALALVRATMEDVRSPDGSPAIGSVPLQVSIAVCDRWSEGK